MSQARTSVCPGCGLALPAHGLERWKAYNASGECRQLFDELCYYTLAQADARFVHQHAVDAYAAQHVDASGKPIGPAFALAGLYLTVEKGFTGRQVQKAHILMARTRREWPRFSPPPFKGTITVGDVLKAQPGDDRDQRLLEWCGSVWNAWHADHGRVRELVREALA
jgi:hypothetical protein